MSKSPLTRLWRNINTDVSMYLADARLKFYSDEYTFRDVFSEQKSVWVSTHPRHVSINTTGCIPSLVLNTPSSWSWVNTMQDLSRASYTPFNGLSQRYQILASMKKKKEEKEKLSAFEPFKSYWVDALHKCLRFFHLFLLIRCVFMEPLTCARHYSKG